MPKTIKMNKNNQRKHCATGLKAKATIYKQPANIIPPCSDDVTSWVKKCLPEEKE